MTDAEAEAWGFGGAECARRRQVLRETVAALAPPEARDRLHQAAHANLARWAAGAPAAEGTPTVEVLPGDWGEVAAALTKRHGRCFAVLNMANAHVPGGAYVEGAPAQEENMFRRTDCHFRVTPEEYDETRDRYRPGVTRLLSALDGRVHFDPDHPRVCVRGPEDRSRRDLGYRWLAEDEVFPFFELRAAARDRRDGSPFDAADMRRRISAQLDTLTAAGQREVVLGAFGCGAFRNPADRVAAIYREEIERRRSDFSVIAFAIFAPGYGPDNLKPFQDVFC